LPDPHEPLSSSEIAGTPEYRSPVPDLIRMANQIAANFAHHPVDQAAREVAAHLTAFWTPTMRSELEAWVAAGGEELHPLAVEAVRISNHTSH
jgi:formate dehydrogenase subunit delta